MSEFIDANLPILIERGVPPQLAIDAINLLDAQNRGELPCPLEGDDLHIVRSAYTWMTAPSGDTPTQQ